MQSRGSTQEAHRRVGNDPMKGVHATSPGGGRIMKWGRGGHLLQELKTLAEVQQGSGSLGDFI